jgi:hypothetical protein
MWRLLRAVFAPLRWLWVSLRWFFSLEGYQAATVISCLTVAALLTLWTYHLVLDPTRLDIGTAIRAAFVIAFFYYLPLAFWGIVGVGRQFGGPPIVNKYVGLTDGLAAGVEIFPESLHFAWHGLLAPLARRVFRR